MPPNQPEFGELLCPCAHTVALHADQGCGSSSGCDCPLDPASATDAGFAQARIGSRGRHGALRAIVRRNSEIDPARLLHGN